jgi:hypothetical protein
VSFAGLGFFAFYLAGKLHLFDKRGHTVWFLPLSFHLATAFLMSYFQSKAWLAVAPFMGAALVAISRTMDYRRRPFFFLFCLCLDLFISSWQTIGMMSSLVRQSVLCLHIFRIASTTPPWNLPYHISRTRLAFDVKRTKSCPLTVFVYLVFFFQINNCIKV